MKELAIEVHDLRKSYGPVEAVRGVSFSVGRGEVFGLLGPNGAGKTTTVEILEGYRERSGGDVEVLGHDPATRDRDLQQRVGVVLQSCGFHPQLTPREAVEHAARGYPKPRDVRETISLVGLEDKSDVRIKQLSGGQQRRLDLAMALVGDPELIFLDEPTTGFDPAARRVAWTAVRALKDLGKTVVLTTHYLDEAQTLADRVAIVKEGRIVAEGPPSDLGPGLGGLPRLLPGGRRARRGPDRRPHRPAAPPDRRRADPRRAAGGAGGDQAVARGRVPGADRRGTIRGARMSSASMAWAQFRLERKLFWRNPSAAFFSFGLPLLILLLVASVFANEPDELDVLIPGVAGMSVMATTFNAMAFNVTFRREQGLLKRALSTPMPLSSYFTGFLGNAVANAFVQVGLVVVLGHLLFDVDWPRDWGELIVFTAVGVFTFGSLGIALSQAIPNVDSAAAYVNIIFLPAIFISGVFYSSDSLPPALDAIAQALPLKHVIDGFSGAIVTGQGLADNAGALAIVGAWGIAGIVLAVRNLPLGVSAPARASYSSRLAAHADSSWRVLSCSLRSTDDTCASTVLAEMPSRSAISLYM